MSLKMYTLTVDSVDHLFQSMVTSSYYLQADRHLESEKVDTLWQGCMFFEDAQSYPIVQSSPLLWFECLLVLEALS